MVGHRNGDCSVGESLLHYDVAASPAHFRKSMTFEDFANVHACMDAQLSQRLPPGG
jgi:hypothetical protein